MKFSADRRTLLRLAALSLPLALAACAGDDSRPSASEAPKPRILVSQADAERYGPKHDEQFTVPGVPPEKLKPRFVRQIVPNPTGEAPGTIVVDPANRFLYLVQEDGMAMRYGVGVGKEGLAWSGTASVGAKREWPRWTPTKSMIAREPERYGPHAGGMEPGPKNPLGARALYLHANGRDTLYRIHGTNEPMTIGTAVSSGCIRMMNQDIIDLYGRVPSGSKVVVLSEPGAIEQEQVGS